MFLASIAKGADPKTYGADLVNLDRLDGLTVTGAGTGITRITLRSGEATAAFVVELDATVGEVVEAIKRLVEANRVQAFAVAYGDQLTASLKRVKGLS